MFSAATAAATAGLLAAAAAGAACVRARAEARLARIAARLAREREGTFAAAARRLGIAARRSTAAVRSEIDAALRAVAPAIDAVLIFDDADADLQCSYATGERVAYFTAARIARSDRSALPIAALACGHRLQLEPGLRALHPADAFALAVPLPREDGRVAVVYAAARSPIDAAAVEAMVMVVDHAGFAYALAGERETDRRRAEYDALTGLLTPRALRERLAALVERARFAPLARIALLFVDTDHFKAWNDTYGHASGDALLRALARLLRAATAGDEIAARNGGDEFCVVFVDTEKSRALERAEAVRAQIAALELDGLRPPGAPPGPAITASIGVAAFPVDATDPSTLLERADEAMYHSKRTGRNAVSYRTVDGSLVRAGM